MTRRRGPRRIATIAEFLGWYVLQFLHANYTVAKEIVTPGDGLTPAFVEVSLQARTRWEIASYISLIALTPGTLVINLSADRTRLVAHGMHAGDPATFHAQLVELERRMLAAWRSGGPAPPADPSSERGPT